MKKFVIFSGILAMLMTACSPSADQLSKVLEEHPEVLTNAIEKNPDIFMTALQKAAQQAQKVARDREMKEEQEAREAEFKSPKTAVIESDRAILGKKDAPITIVEYSDFQCPFCARAHGTVEEVLKKYDGKVRVVFKHLPLDFHPMAMPASQRFEAIAIQSHSKAYKFHDEIFRNQGKLKSNGEKWMDDVAKKLGVDVAKMKKDMTSETVKKRIDADMAEAKKYGFSGTPGFLVGGVSLRGAYPVSEFEQIIDRILQEQKK